MANSGFELVLLHVAAGISVNQARYALSALVQLLVHAEPPDVIGRLIRRLQASLILLREPLWVFEKRTYLMPHCLFQAVRSYLLVGANPLPTEAVCIASDTTVVGIVTLMSFGA